MDMLCFSPVHASENLHKQYLTSYRKPAIYGLSTAQFIRKLWSLKDAYRFHGDIIVDRKLLFFGCTQHARTLRHALLHAALNFGVFFSHLVQYLLVS